MASIIYCGKNPALSCLIGFVSMDHAKQQNYSSITVQVTVHWATMSCTPPSYEWSARFHKCSSPFRRHVGHQDTGSTCHTEIQCRAAGMKHPSHGVGVVMSNEASNHKAAPFPQLSWRDEVIMLKNKLEGRSNHHFARCWIRFSLIFFKLTTCCFCLMWEVDRLGKALTRGTAC